jgi:hypothetical protein
MLRRRIAGTVCSVTFGLLGLAVVPGVAAATAPAANTPAATSPAPSSAASADPGYPAQSPLLTVSSGSVQVGGSVLLTGRGFQSGEGVDVSVTYSPASHALGTAVGPVAQPAAFTLRHIAGHAVSAAHAFAASDGEFSTHVSLTEPGNATITATGEQSHLSIAATVSVMPATSVAATKSTKRALPFSNTTLRILVLAIVALLVAAVAWRRRSRKSSAAPGVSAVPDAPDAPHVPELAAARNISTA